MRNRLFAAIGLMAVAVLSVLLVAQPAAAQQGSNLYQWSGGYGSSGGGGMGGGYYSNPGTNGNFAGYNQANPNQSFYPAQSGRTGWQTRADGWLYYWNQGQVLGAFDRDKDAWYSYTGNGWSRSTTPPWKNR